MGNSGVTFYVKFSFIVEQALKISVQCFNFALPKRTKTSPSAPMRSFLLLMLTVSLALGARAQSLAGNQQQPIVLDMVDGSGDWTFHQDHDNGILYIDFARVGSQVVLLYVRNPADKSMLMREEMLDIPSDIIYELDLKQFGQGDFTVELVTYKDIVRTEIQIGASR